MKFLIPLIAFAFYSCCKCSETTRYIADWKNGTSHRIKIVGYTQGIIVAGDTVYLGPGEELRIADGMTMGPYQGFIPDHFNSVDSLVVTFDSLYRVTHYLRDPAVQFPKSYLFTSDRNLLNAGSYQKSPIKGGNAFTYEFTEADYQFAL